MLDPVLKSEIIQALESLPPNQQRQVVAYAYSLNSVSPQGTPWSALKNVFGIMPKEDADEMMNAINDHDGW